MKYFGSLTLSLDILTCILFFQAAVIKASDTPKKSRYCSVVACWQKTACALHTARKQQRCLQDLPDDTLDKICHFLGRPPHITHTLESVPYYYAQAFLDPGYGTFEHLEGDQYRLTPYLAGYKQESENYLPFVVKPGDLSSFAMVTTTRNGYFIYDPFSGTGYLSGKPHHDLNDEVTKIAPASTALANWYDTLQEVGFPPESIKRYNCLKLGVPEERAPSSRRITGFKVARESRSKR